MIGFEKTWLSRTIAKCCEDWAAWLGSKPMGAVAQRGAATAPIGFDPSQAAQSSQHFAIVLDNQVFSNPIINYQENPTGIDGRQGAQISGNFTISSAQD